MQKIIVLAIFLIGLSLRLYKIDLPLLEFYPSRQVQTAEITRNLYRDGFNILAPAVSYLGPDKQLFLVEFPLYNFFVALIYQLAGSPSEYLGRIFSISGWIFSCFFLYKISKTYAGEKVALTALFFYTFSPLSVLTSRSFQPDQWMLSLSLASIYFIDISKGKGPFFYLGILFSSLSFLIKIPSILFTLAPVAYLIKNNQTKWLLKIIVFSSFTIIPSIAWYLYASIVSRAGGVLTTSSEISNWFGLSLFWNPKYWANMFGFENNLTLLPVGLILFFLGLASKLKKNQFLLYFWLGSVILYFLVFNKHNMTHEYYHLPFLPVAAIFIGIGVQRIFEAIGNFVVPKSWLFVVMGLFLLVLMLPPTLARAYKPIDRFRFVPETAMVIQEMTKSSDLVIGSMDAGPTLVYYADRVGWTFEVNRDEQASQFAFYGTRDKIVVDPIREIEALRRDGALIFASAYKDQFLQNRAFSQYMYKNFEVLFENENYIIFDLKEKLNAD